VAAFEQERLMDLVVVRHAIAGDREEWARTGRPDRDRPVTPEGRTRMEENAAGIRTLVPQIDLVATSPYTRAVQTAEVFAHAYGDVEIVELPALAHGGPPEAVRDWLAQRAEECIALVGHEPDLGCLISWLVLGTSEPPLSLKKGGAALLRFDDVPDRGRATLRWLAPPRLLRRLEP
jgi:phosphohistidine phosphatase